MKIDEEAFAKDLDFIKAMIHYDIDDALFGVTERQKNLIAQGPAGAVRALAVRRGRQADRAGQEPDRQQGRELAA